MKVHVGNPPSPAVAPPAPRNGSESPSPNAGRQRQQLQCVGEVKILILDDDPSVCEVIRAALTNPSYQLEAESDPGQMEAHLQAKSKEYDLILLDYILPGLQPEQVFGWVKEHQPHASIIVITGYPSMDSALNCLRAQTFDYLTKPFQINQLQETVTRCLEKKGLLRMSEEALREALGAVIRERRKAQGLTLSDLAKRTKVSLGYLSQIELGKNSASIETLYRISLGLGTKLAELFQAVQQRC